MGDAVSGQCQQRKETLMLGPDKRHMPCIRYQHRRVTHCTHLRYPSKSQRTGPWASTGRLSEIHCLTWAASAASAAHFLHDKRYI
jgi:hypothetical protein